jgi:hypothetical protein
MNTVADALRPGTRTPLDDDGRVIGESRAHLSTMWKRHRGTRKSIRAVARATGGSDGLIGLLLPATGVAFRLRAGASVRLPITPCGTQR